VNPIEARIRAVFAEAFGGAPDCIARAPGRVNLIGEHTDYNDGFVLPAAISVQTLVAARRRGDGEVHAVAADFGNDACRFPLAPPIARSDGQPWSNYLRGMLQAMQAEGLKLPGADLVLAGNVPQGSGLSSSASLEVAVGTVFAGLAGLAIDRTRIARLGQAAECDFVGTQCGIMDQLVSARGQEGHALLIDCRSLDCRPIAMPQDLAIMIVHSGITRGLVEGAYNERRAQCEAAARKLGVPALRDADLAMLDAARTRLAPLEHARARHVITENVRTLAAAEALERNDLAALGNLMAQSHISMRDDFAITLPPIDALVYLLQQAIGDQGGARMTGGGFGGAVVALMPSAETARVAAAVRAGYRTPAGDEPAIMLETASAGASFVR
jgi:galactokinase